MKNLPDLSFPALPYGTHEGQFNLISFIYLGASAIPSDQAMALIEKNTLGSPDYSRLELAKVLHEDLSSQITRGVKPTTVKNRIRILRSFYSWCDRSQYPMTIESVPTAYRAWVEHLLHRVRIEKSIYNVTAYRLAIAVDRLLKPALGLTVGLISTTRIKANSKKHKALGTDADRQNLEQTFKFGHFLVDVANGLKVDAISGPLPIEIRLRTGDVIIESGGQTSIAGKSISKKSRERNQFIERRAPIDPRLVFIKRTSAANLKIGSELLIFISQTGMNLSQAAKLKRGSYRYQSAGEEVNVYKVYKGRRGGTAEFTIFKEYAVIFKAYLEWLDQVSDNEDERLFPFIYSTKIPAAEHLPVFSQVDKQCKKLGIKFIRPMALRKTRVNWLLRKSRDPDLVAEMAQHTKEVLLSIYAEPHHQVATVEISRFYQATDPAMASSGPGVCLSAGAPPASVSPDAAYIPDCSTPAGCLFCEYQRDLDTEDYVWSLTTYRQLKALELDRYTSPETDSVSHPAVALIDKINRKLINYSETEDYRAKWVVEAELRMREGRYHPNYEGLINLLEFSQ